MRAKAKQLSNSEIRAKIQKIKNSKHLSKEMKIIALSCLKEQWLKQRTGEDGFSLIEKEQAEEGRKNLIFQAVKKGLPQMLAEKYSIKQLHDYIIQQTGIRTALDESELA